MFSFSSSSTRGLTPLVPLAAAVHLLVLSSSVSVADPAMALKLNLKPERGDDGYVSPAHIESTDLEKIGQTQSVISKLQNLRSERSMTRRKTEREELQEFRLNFLRETIEAFQETEVSEILRNSLRKGSNFLEVDIVQVEQSKQKVYDLREEKLANIIGPEYYKNDNMTDEVEVVDFIRQTVDAYIFFLDCLDFMGLVSAADEQTAYFGRGTTPEQQVVQVQVSSWSWFSNSSRRLNEDKYSFKGYSKENFWENGEDILKELKYIESDKMKEAIAPNNIFNSTSIKKKLITAEQFGGLISFMKEVSWHGFELK